MSADVATILAGYSSAALSAIVRARGLRSAGNRKEQNAEAILGSLFAPNVIKRAYEHLALPDRQALDLLMLRGGEAGSVSFRRQLLRAGLVVPSPQKDYFNAYRGSPHRHDSRYFEDLIARLTVAGLVFGDRSGVSAIDLETPGDRLLIPDVVMASLPPVARVLPEPPPMVTSDTRPGPGALLQRDLYLYWRYARRNDLALTARGMVLKRHLAKIVESLVVGEDMDLIAGEQELGRTLFVRRLLEELGLLRQEGQRLIAAPEALEFFALSRAERARRSFHSWLAGTRWNELSRLPDVVADYFNNSPRNGAPPLVVKARQFVISLLAGLPAERWVSLAHLWQRAMLVDYEFLLSRDFRTLASHSYYYGRSLELNPYDRSGNNLGWTFKGLSDDEAGWQAVEGGFIAGVVAEPLHWLGLVDLAYERGRMVGFRINDLGDRILREDVLPEEAAATGQVVVQPNFQLFAFDPIGEHVLAMLDRFADLVRAEQAVEFRLSRESVYRGQQEGVAIAEVTSFLERISGRPLPQNVLRSLEDWGRHHERIVVRRGIGLVHCASPELLDALFGEARLASHLGRPVSPEAALIKRGAPGIDPLAGALLARGFLPATIRQGNIGEEGKVTVEPDGRLSFPRPGRSIYLSRCLLPLAEERDGVLALTHHSVQRALRGGLDVEQIVTRLEAVHRGSLPSSVLNQIKVWAKHWGDATLAPVTLLYLKDEAVLSDLLADPTTGALLKPFVVQGAAALVQPEDFERLREALREKGIELREEE